MEKKKKLEFRYYEVEKDFPVLALLGKRWEIPYGTDPMHFHNHLEIGYCYYGTGDICHGNERTPYKKGTITVIPRNHLHRTTGNGDEVQKWEYLFIDSEQFLKNMFQDDPMWGNKIQQILEKRCLILDEETAFEMGVCVKLCLREMREKKEFYKESAGSMLQALFVYVLRLYEQEYVNMKNPEGGGGKKFQALQRVLGYIDKNYGENIGIEQLTKIGNMSESNLRRQFRECMHTSPAEYINLIRVDHACDLLANTNEKVENIAVRTGFQTSGSMIRNFKKMVDMTPGEWRKKVERNGIQLANYRISILKGW